MEKPLAEILPTIHNALLKPARKAVRLLADNNPAIRTACPEAGKVRIAEANSTTISPVSPNQAKKVARLPAGGNPLRLINRPAVGREADATPMSLMIATKNQTWDARVAG